MSRHPGIYKRGNIYWITYRWQGRLHQFKIRRIVRHQ